MHMYTYDTYVDTDTNKNTQKHNINHNTTLVCSTLHHTTRHVFVHNTALEHNRAHTHTDTIDLTKKSSEAHDENYCPPQQRRGRKLQTVRRS